MNDSQKRTVLEGRIDGVEHEQYGLEVDLKAAKAIKDEAWQASIQESLDRAQAKAKAYAAELKTLD
jgi:hypothetical protein